MKFHSTNGSVEEFNRNWVSREETNYSHWVKVEPKNQIQLAFKQHWFTFQEILKNSGYNNGHRVLEVGAGRGSLSSYFSDAGYNCTLVDISAKVISVAQEIFKKNNLKAEFHIADAHSLPFDDGTFDIVFSIGLLEHFEKVEEIIKEQLRILTKNGLFIAYIVPHYDNNVQIDFNWINEILKGYKHSEIQIPKEDVFRSDYGSEYYLRILESMNLQNIRCSGIYPLPLISHSIEFPFSLMPPKSEEFLVKHFNLILNERVKDNKNPWLCEEGYGQAFLIWGKIEK